VVWEGGKVAGLVEISIYKTF
jgi:hypothetical protein